MKKLFYCCLLLIHTAIVHAQSPDIRDITEFRLILGGVLDAKSDILYNSKTGNSVYLGGVSPDSLTHFLPPFAASDDILACDGLNFYGAVSSYTLHEAKDRMKTPSFNTVMEAYFKNTTSKVTR